MSFHLNSDNTGVYPLNLSEAFYNDNAVVNKEVALTEGMLLWSLYKMGLDIPNMYQELNINFDDVINNYSVLAGLAGSNLKDFNNVFITKNIIQFEEDNKYKALEVFNYLAINNNNLINVEKEIINFIKYKLNKEEK